MRQIKAYHRPQSLEAAVEYLARPDVTTVVVAGGLSINPAPIEDVDEVVDLQAVGLDYIRSEGDGLALGAMTRIQTLVDSGQIPELLREMARREGPNTFRNQGALGGVVVDADPESELLAALLASEAEVTLQSLAGPRTLSLPDFLADVPAALGGGILTEVRVMTDGMGAGERVARTPADKPIVAVVGRKTEDGRVFLAACGVAPAPILIDPDQLDALDPPADFRGSSEYRKEMAALLAERVLTKLNSN